MAVIERLAEFQSLKDWKTFQSFFACIILYQVAIASLLQIGRVTRRRLLVPWSDIHGVALDFDSRVLRCDRWAPQLAFTVPMTEISWVVIMTSKYLFIRIWEAPDAVAFPSDNPMRWGARLGVLQLPLEAIEAEWDSSFSWWYRWLDIWFERLTKDGAAWRRYWHGCLLVRRFPVR